MPTSLIKQLWFFSTPPAHYLYPNRSLFRPHLPHNVHSLPQYTFLQKSLLLIPRRHDSNEMPPLCFIPFSHLFLPIFPHFSCLSGPVLKPACPTGEVTSRQWQFLLLSQSQNKSPDQEEVRGDPRPVRARSRGNPGQNRIRSGNS